MVHRVPPANSTSLWSLPNIRAGVVRMTSEFAGMVKVALQAARQPMARLRIGTVSARRVALLRSTT
jgi:hypothetical protein